MKLCAEVDGHGGTRGSHAGRQTFGEGGGEGDSKAASVRLRGKMGGGWRGEEKEMISWFMPRAVLGFFLPFLSFFFFLMQLKLGLVVKR